MTNHDHSDDDDDDSLHHENIDALWLTLSLPQPSSSSSSSSSSSPPPSPSYSSSSSSWSSSPPLSPSTSSSSSTSSSPRPLTSSTNLSITLKTFLKSKIVNRAAALSGDASSLTLSQPSLSSPRPSPFEYTPLTPPMRFPNHPQTFFYSQVISQTQQHGSEPKPDLSQEKDPHQEKQEQDHVSLPNPITSTSNRKVSGRRQCSQQSTCPAKKRKLKSETVPPPFPWTTSKRATVHTLDHLLSELKLKTISGTLQCKYCNFQQDNIQFDLVEKFNKVTKFIEENKHEMHDRAPDAWINPVLPRCESCGKEKAMQPSITKKRNINWLFLLLGEMIGCCKLKHLKYFCKHSDLHRTGAKDRLIYLTYLGLCKQLQPEGPFNP